MWWWSSALCLGLPGAFTATLICVVVVLILVTLGTALLVALGVVSWLTS